ncbi:helix-turn-helix domain-containing protein [Lentzea aerocolonigenes]|uniref:helix-turn-helix domain-containing protein n=1 Tax=Lentzea aerocolonigenes TaxID=68170 RepID=UPI0004C38B7E|nr:helix-turn-helix domain-containing protein [Lentzea aerocolonigenes]MCP2243387.1 Transcriptional regulator, contains XRE-family HTH domain [Lentzea aerocolonigenes]
MADVASLPEGSLAAKVDHLFRTVHSRAGREYTFEEVAEAIRLRGGPTISATYVWQLRRGLRDNPTKRHLEALAGFFGVPPAYFFDDAVTEQIDSELALLTALRDSSVRRMALRASGLSPKSLGALTAMVERARELEGLPDGPDEEAGS